MPPIAKHLHICWLSHVFSVPYCKWKVFLISGEQRAWSVFGWDLNVEQAKEVFHAAHESQFALTEQLQMPHTSVCRAVILSWQLLQAGWSLCMDIVCVLSEAENLMYGCF